MKVKFKDTANIQRGAKNGPRLTTSMSSSPKSITYNLQTSEFNNSYNSRPLKSNSSNLAFKGLSSFFYKESKTLYKSNEILDIAQEHIGASARRLFEDLKVSPFAKKMFKVNETGEVVFYKKTIPKLLIDGMLYPIKVLPADILNGIVGGLRKIKPLQKWADNLYNIQFFKNIRQRSKIDAKVNSMHGLFKTVQDHKSGELSSTIFQQRMKMFDPKTGNYDTKHERALNRIVTGLPPAIFLANDAYNLSRMCDDNSAEAKKEKKIRFKQEVSRIGLSGYLTLVTLGALNKYINNSRVGIMLMTGTTVLFTEMVSRLSNGKHIVRLSPEKAKEVNAKLNINQPEEVKETPVANYKNVFFKAKEQKKFASFNGNIDFKGFSKPVDNTKEKPPLLSMNSILKGSAIIVAAGFGIKGLRKITLVDNAFKATFKPFKDLYETLTVDKKYTFSGENFNKIVDKLEENGYVPLAKKYREVASELYNKAGDLDLGQRDKKIKPVVNFVIAPFKFAYNTVSLPYTLVKKALGAFKKAPVKTPVDIKKGDIEALKRSIETVGKRALAKDFDAKKFKDFMDDNTLKSFNLDTMSNVSNSELSNLAKTAAAAATIGFLMTDNYNMVMLKSNGKDVDGAKLKYRERFVQEGSRLFYQTLLIDLFNSTFRTQYNKSLWGMAWISTVNTTMGEWLTRKSVGTPVKTHTRDEILALEKEKEDSTGFLKGYYNFMSRLTGKKSLKEQSEAKVVKK